MEAIKKVVENWNEDLIPCYEDIAENIYSDFGKSILSYDFNLPFGQIKRIIYEIMKGEVDAVTIQYIDPFKGIKECKTVDDEDICQFYIDNANKYITTYLEKMIPIWDKENEEWKQQLHRMRTSQIYR
jgi:translation initiation factor 2 beta subunit (eIF-2beta)/eIF-5